METGRASRRASDAGLARKLIRRGATNSAGRLEKTAAFSGRRARIGEMVEI
jgi:hypothetical protein